MLYADRSEAGRALGAALGYLRSERPLLLGLPRGGIAVAAAAAEVLEAELDMILVRKLGVPWQPELAFGAIGEDGVRVLNADILHDLAVTPDQANEVEQRERAELDRRTIVLRAGHPRVPLRDRTIVIVDDGMATGATALAACRVARHAKPQRLILAVPVSSPSATQRLATEAEQLICLAQPTDLGGVGAAYRDFHQLEDHEVVYLLRKAAPRLARPHPLE